MIDLSRHGLDCDHCGEPTEDRQGFLPAPLARLEQRTGRLALLLTAEGREDWMPICGDDIWNWPLRTRDALWGLIAFTALYFVAQVARAFIQA